MEPNLRRRVRNFILQTLLVFVVLLLAAWAAIAILKPGPAGKIVLASGGADGLYDELAQSYKKDLERFGVEVELRPQVEGIETLKALLSKYKAEFKNGFDERNADIQAGFMKGGFSGSLRGRLTNAREQKWHERQVESLSSVGRLFYEPVWVFYRGSEPIKSLRDFKNKKIIVGSKASGARRVVLQLLKANGVDDKNAKFVDEDVPDDAAPLISGDADAAFIILPPDSKKVQQLLRNPKIRLLDFGSEADAYSNRFPALSKIVLMQGAVEFDPDIPASNVTLLATSAALVIKKDLHPALASLLTYAVIHNPKSGFDKAGDPILFYTAGEFPNGHDPEFDLSSEARQVYKTGELPVLLRSFAAFSKQLGLPFWPAAFAYTHGTQTVLLLIPLLSILLPLMRLLPMLYTWSVRRRLLNWYRQLKALEDSLDDRPTQDHLAAKLAEVERIDAAVARIRVPLNFSDQLYDLRGHIDLVRQRLAPRAAGLKAAA